MKQTYTFTVTIEDSGDEFSAEFNPNEEDQVAAFEESMKDILENNPPFWDSTWRLTAVTVEL